MGVLGSCTSWNKNVQNMSVKKVKMLETTTFSYATASSIVNNEPMKAAKQNNSNKFISMSGYLIHQKSIKPIQLLVSRETEYSERKKNNIGNSYSTPSFSF